jgi:hypothetical protein
MKKNGKKTAKMQNSTPFRASISIPPDPYEILEELAMQKKVSLAWIVRDGSEKYVANLKRAEANIDECF